MGPGSPSRRRQRRGSALGPGSAATALPAAERHAGAGCCPLDDAWYWVGESFADAAAGVRIEVLSADGYGETVRITKS